MTDTTPEYLQLQAIQAAYRVKLMHHWSIVISTQYNSVLTQHWFASQEDAQATHDRLVKAVQDHRKYDLNDDGKVLTFQTIDGCSSVRVADVVVVAVNPPEVMEPTDGQ